MSATDDRSNLVWHYTSAEGLRGAVTHRRLWASSSAFMNDADELLTGQRALHEQFEKRKMNLEKWQIDQLRVAGIGRESSIQQTYLLCAAHSRDALTIWRNYGGDQIPFALGLERDIPLVPVEQKEGDEHPNPPARYYEDEYIEVDEDEYVNNNPDSILILGGAWREVRYVRGGRDREVEAEFDSLLAMLKQPGGDERRIPWSLMDLSFASSPTNYWKNIAFEDEREVRAAWNVNPSWKFLKYRAHRFGLVPYIEVAAGTGDRDYVPAGTRTRLPLRRIMIGPTPMHVEVRSALESLLSDFGYDGVIVEHSSAPYR